MLKVSSPVCTSSIKSYALRATPLEEAEGGLHYFLILWERRQVAESLIYSEARRTKGKLLFQESCVLSLHMND